MENQTFESYLELKEDVLFVVLFNPKEKIDGRSSHYSFSEFMEQGREGLKENITISFNGNHFFRFLSIMNYYNLKKIWIKKEQEKIFSGWNDNSDAELLFVEDAIEESSNLFEVTKEEYLNSLKFVFDHTDIYEERDQIVESLKILNKAKEDPYYRFYLYELNSSEENINPRYVYNSNDKGQVLTRFKI